MAMAMASIPARQHTCSCLPLQDGEVRRAFQRSLQKQGLKFKLGTKVGNAFQSFRPCCFARTAPLTGIDISVSGLVYGQLFFDAGCQCRGHPRRREPHTAAREGQWLHGDDVC